MKKFFKKKQPKESNDNKRNTNQKDSLYSQKKKIIVKTRFEKWSELLEDLQILTLSFLLPEDIECFGLTSWSSWRLIQSEKLWRLLFLRENESPVYDLKNSEFKTWKDAFRSTQDSFDRTNIGKEVSLESKDFVLRHKNGNDSIWNGCTLKTPVSTINCFKRWKLEKYDPNSGPNSWKVVFGICNHNTRMEEQFETSLDYTRKGFATSIITKCPDRNWIISVNYGSTVLKHCEAVPQANQDQIWSLYYVVEHNFLICAINDQIIGYHLFKRNVQNEKLWWMVNISTPTVAVRFLPSTYEQKVNFRDLWTKYVSKNPSLNKDFNFFL